MDYEAVCQHAVNQFITRGHRRLALVNPLAVAAGDARTEAGFLQAVAQQRTTGIQAEVVNHDGTVSGICQRVDGLRSRKQPPTAFLVSRASHFLTVLTHLLNRNVRVPGDVALISREHYTTLEDVVPTAARYFQNPTAFAANASRLVMGMIRGTARIEECKIMPQFIRGETLG
jgi:DNA-binding LacI/PurR family transcriptional regulator